MGIFFLTSQYSIHLIFTHMCTYFFWQGIWVYFFPDLAIWRTYGHQVMYCRGELSQIQLGWTFALLPESWITVHICTLQSMLWLEPRRDYWISTDCICLFKENCLSLAGFFQSYLGARCLFWLLPEFPEQAMNGSTKPGLRPECQAWWRGGKVSTGSIWRSHGRSMFTSFQFQTFKPFRSWA